jgi:uncharacterized protein
MRRIVILFLVLCMILPTVPVQAGRAQATDADAAAQMAYDLSVLEAEGDFNTLYDLIHPDAHAIIPRSAAIGWYQNEFAPMGVSPAAITGVQFVKWTWAVNGVTYPYTAEVSFQQARADGTYLVDVVRLVQDQYGTWRWFFGRSAEFVAEQIARYAQPTSIPTRMEQVFDFVYDDIDSFWAISFSASNERYRTPDFVDVHGVGFSACGALDTGISPAYYCSLDESIFADTRFFELADFHIGDFAWITILAHEWGHHVQYLDGAPFFSSKSYELQADCLAGSYTRDAETRGLLAPGDLLEGIEMMALVGDSIDVPQDHVMAHGTSEERVSAFMIGYLTGFVGCGLDLTDGSGLSLPAQVQPAPTSIVDILPQQRDVPADLSLVSQKERTLAEVVANYTDPVTTERMYRDWGWQGNAIALYSGSGAQSGVTEVYVSVHQLGNRRSAGDALDFSIEDQAASTGAWEIAVSSSAQETRGLRTNADVTLYAREGDYLIRLTVTSWTIDPLLVAIDILESMLDEID